MPWLSRTFLHGVALAAALQGGCATFWPRAPHGEDVPAPVAAGELPPAQAARACQAIARELEKNGHEADAIPQYERARSLDPTLPHVARRLAVLHDRQGHDAKALAEYEAALREHPGDAALLNDLGYFHYQRGRWGEAEAWLRKAVEKEPGNARAWGNLALALGQQQKYDECLAAFGKSVRPSHAYSNLGVLLARHGEADRAREALRQALSLEPGLRQAEVVLARIERPDPSTTKLGELVSVVDGPSVTSLVPR